MAITLRQTGIRELAAGQIATFTADTANKVRQAAERLAPKDTGRMSRTITRKPLKITALHVRATVSTTTGYGLFVEAGTGIYGPTGRPITPRRGRFLVFKPRGSNHVIKVTSVRGQPGQHFMRNALIQTITAL